MSDFDFKLNDMCELLPHQKVMPTDLMQGDVVKSTVGSWILVKAVCAATLGSRTGSMGFDIESFSFGHHYVRTNQELTIVSRDVISAEALNKLVIKLEKAQEKYKEELEEQAKEDRARLIEQRDKLNRMIGDD